MQNYTIDDEGQGLLWVRAGRLGYGSEWSLHSTHRNGQMARQVMAALRHGKPIVASTVGRGAYGPAKEVGDEGTSMVHPVQSRGCL